MYIALVSPHYVMLGKQQSKIPTKEVLYRVPGHPVSRI